MVEGSGSRTGPFAFFAVGEDVQCAKVRPEGDTHYFCPQNFLKNLVRWLHLTIGKIQISLLVCLRKKIHDLVSIQQCLSHGDMEYKELCITCISVFQDPAQFSFNIW